MTTKWLPPKRGDIVLCFYPLEEEPHKPGPYLRPALVLDISTNKGVFVCYGTGQAHHKNQESIAGHEFGIFEMRHLSATSLDEATIFDLSRTAWLPFDDKWFGEPRGNPGSPVIGKMRSCKSLKPVLFTAMAAANLAHLLPPSVSTTASSSGKKTGT